MKKLKLERVTKGWSQAELARQSGLNVTTINLIENGRMIAYPTQLLKLARALDIPETDANQLEQEADYGTVA